VTILTLLTWVPLGGCILACAGIVAAFAASAWSDLHYRPKVHWQPGGPWYPPTDPAATAPLGTLPAAVEEEIARGWVSLIPDRPAVPNGSRNTTERGTA